MVVVLYVWLKWRWWPHYPGFCLNKTQKIHDVSGIYYVPLVSLSAEGHNKCPKRHEFFVFYLNKNLGSAAISVILINHYPWYYNEDIFDDVDRSELTIFKKMIKFDHSFGAFSGVVFA